MALSMIKPAPKLNVSKLKEFRHEAAMRYTVYRNTRIGGYDIFETGNIFLGHYDTAIDARRAQEKLEREYIMLLLDCTEKKYN